MSGEEVESIYELSPAQQGMLFQSIYAPGSGVYVLQLSLRLSGPLDLPLFERAWQRVVERHPILRTAFFWEDLEKPVQVVYRQVDLTLESESWRGLDAGEQSARLEAYLSADRERGFEPEEAPLMRLALFEIDQDVHQLVWSHHHLLNDGWSQGLLMRELFTIYPALAAGPAGGEPVLDRPRPYREYIAWLQRQDLGEAEAFWRRYLAGLSTPTLVSGREGQQAVSTDFRSSRRRQLRLGEEETAALRDMARRHRLTLNTLVQGAWALLLGRSMNVRQVVFGAAVAGRPEDLPGAESIIGPFINTLPMRVDLAPESRLDSWLADLQAGQVEQRRYAYAPLYQVQQWSELPAGLALFDCILAFENYPLDATLTSLLPGLGISDVRANELTNFPLELVAVPGAELLLEMRHDTGHFEPARVARMLEHLAALLRSFPFQAEAGLWELPALLPAERHQILREWNDTSRPHGLEGPLHGLFERQAGSAPDAVAAWFGEAGLSYGELDRRAERLARHLAGLARPDAQVYVALCMDRSLEMLIGLTGILAAGLAYVPLEPAWPAERKRWILDSLQVRCAVTGTSQLRPMQELQWQLPALAELIVLDAGERRPPAEPLAVETVREMWDGVAERAGDRVMAGGFVSSYTGQPFAEAEVDEYRDRVVALASPWIRPDARVLEIGSGSGLILFEVAPRVGRYVGLDPSGLTQERTRREAAERGLGNVELPTAFAHELEAAGTAADAPFDLVIIASTAQFFPGPLYLERVLAAAFARLAPGGAVLVADVPDLRRREEFRASLDDFRAAHRGEEGLRTRSRFDELYLDEDLFQDLAAALPALAGAEVFHRRQGFGNELRFRYDVLLRKAAPGEEVGARPARRKEVRTFWHLEQAAGEAPALPTVSAGAIAYVIFTSGSTGTPKGVVVRHRPAVHLVDWVNRTFAVGPRDRVLFITSPCFDLSVYDVFGLLGAGGSLRIASDADLRDPERLVRWLVEDGITFWDSAPAALQQLVPFLPPRSEGGQALRLVFLSGDWIPLRLPDSVRESFPAARVISLGGATEATVWSNFFPVRAVDPGWASIPYGRPIHDAGYFVLDSWFEPCPVGVAGDLYIGGECLASGYAGDPALTASKFLPDPWSARPGGRLYRTGDLARFFADGNLEFLGRADHQVKIRGFRIELGEIEATLLRHPAVREAVVVALGTTLEDRRLAAYVVADPVPPAEIKTELKSWLQERLTDVMVPSAFTFLEAMPVTANGKLDRQALPDPGAASEASDQPGEGPRTEMEERLCAVFSELLKVPRVRSRDSFFELGGHSLLATLLLARVRTEFGVHLSLGQIFREPTVAGLAALVRRLRMEQESPADAIVAGPPPDGPVPLSPGQRRLWFVEQLESHGAYNIAAAVRLVGPLDLASLARTLAEVARRHETLRTRFEERSGQPVQVIEPFIAEFVPELPLADLAALPDGCRQDEARRLAAATARRPFHLGSAPLLRCLLLRLDAGDHAMVCSMHHIVSDGWSLRVLVRELAVLYRAFSRGLPSPLPEPPVQYRDFVLWEQRRLAGQLLDEQLEGWRKHLAGAPAFLALPTDRPRPPVQSFRGSYRSFRLEAGLTEALRGVTVREGCTLFMLLLASWQTLLHFLTGQDDVVVNAPLAFREQPEIEGAIGFFAQTLLFRTRFGGAATFAELLGRVRAGVEEAYLRPYAPLDKLVEELAPERNLSYTPFMQAGINYIDAEPLREPEEAGLQTLPFEFDPGTSQFDLSLALSRATDGLEGGLQFRTDLFGMGTVTSFVDQLRHLLELVAARPEIPLLELGQAVAGEAERRQAEANREMQQASRLTFQRRQRRGIDIASANHG